MFRRQLSVTNLSVIADFKFQYSESHNDQCQQCVVEMRIKQADWLIKLLVVGVVSETEKKINK